MYLSAELCSSYRMNNRLGLLYVWHLHRFGREIPGPSAAQKFVPAGGKSDCLAYGYVFFFFSACIWDLWASSVMELII